MINEKQLEIATAILEYINEKGEFANKLYLYKYLIEKKFEFNDITPTISFIENDYKLITLVTGKSFGQETEFYKITNNGYKALELGVEEYIKKKDKESQKSNSTIIISIIALLISSILPGIKLFETIFPKKESVVSNNGKYDSYYSKYQTDSVINNTLPNETFIDALKDSLKHDTKFLNELKVEMNEKEYKNKITTP